LARNLRSEHAHGDQALDGLGPEAAHFSPLLVLLNVFEPDFFTVLVPVACYAFGIAFATPALTTAALAPKVTKAPKPITPVGGGASGGTPSLTDDALASDYSAWRKVRSAQQR